MTFFVVLGLAVLAAVVLIGSLYHRAMGLPEDQREHGLRVLAELTHLCQKLLRRSTSARPPALMRRVFRSVGRTRDINGDAEIEPFIDAKP